MSYSTRASDDEIGRQPHKQSVLKDSRSGMDERCNRGRIVHWSERTIQDQVALIGQEWCATQLQSEG
jgi:hypothetical protein